jgi:hypothetical protein
MSDIAITQVADLATMDPFEQDDLEMLIRSAITHDLQIAARGERISSDDPAGDYTAFRGAWMMPETQVEVYYHGGGEIVYMDPNVLLDALFKEGAEDAIITD